MPLASSAFADSPHHFSAQLIAWQREHGRHTLPWQGTRDAYKIWLSEIMLQQTQVTTVIPYFLRFLAQFPDVHALAAAPSDAVMALWSGLGYYARARNLHRCAQDVFKHYEGIFPTDPAVLVQLPGIGRSTAAAIAAFSSGKRVAILDGNVKRIFCRIFGISGVPSTKSVENTLWELAEKLLPETDIEPYTQGLMDLGATLCKRTHPQCEQCPFEKSCIALATDNVANLPTRKQKKNIPLKQATMLTLVQDGRILLEKRPAKGIWGGLWSLPELDTTNSSGDVAHLIYEAGSSYGTIQRCAPLSDFVHVFTHFRLAISPWRIDLKTAGNKTLREETGALVWLPLSEIDDAPLPSPIRQLLRRI